MQKYNKMWAALLTGAAGFAALQWPSVAQSVGEEQIMAATTLLSTFTVYLVPNRDE